MSFHWHSPVPKGPRGRLKPITTFWLIAIPPWAASCYCYKGNAARGQQNKRRGLRNWNRQSNLT